MKNTTTNTIYLDNAATTPVDPRVAACMTDCLQSDAAFGNPAASNHDFGVAADALIEQARGHVAALIGGVPEGVVWTSGATESDNLAILGTARFREMQGRHVISSLTEHSAVIGACHKLESEGFMVSLLHPDGRGVIDPQQVIDAIHDETTLVSIMHANNETGVVQDVAAIGKICRERDVLFHVDAAQSAGRLPIDVEKMNIDLLSLSGHKLYGPKGIGVLYMNRERISRVDPLMFGGGHERGLRPGTLPTHQIAGMGKAFEIAAGEMDADVLRVAGLREQLWQGLSAIPGIIRNSEGADTLCSILSVTVPDVEGESLLLALRGLAVASGSACNSANDEASYVMRALGHSDQLAQSTIRLSLGRFNTEEDVLAAVSLFAEAVHRLRSIAGTQVV